MNKQQTTFVTFVAIAAATLLSPFIAESAAPPKALPAPRELALEMGAPFHDHAILQREMKVPVWGWSKSGTKITVTFAGQKKSTTVGKDGNASSSKDDVVAKWMVWLDPMDACFEPREMVISEAGGRSETLKDILVGEVWLTSGQSNMQWPAQNCIVGRKLIPEILARVQEGKEKMPIIREAKVTNGFSSIYPTKNGRGQWSDEWQGFSAISFAFAYNLAKELQIPIGIVNGAFSTTRLEAWVPREGFAAGTDEYTKAIYQKILESDYRSTEHKVAWDAYYQGLRDWGKECAANIKKGLPVNKVPGVPGNMNGNRDATWMYNTKINPMVPYAIRGAIWNQGYANGNDGITYRNNLHSLIHGWRTVWNRPELPVYFHQFYCPGKSYDDGITLNSVAEMRLGTWLASKEISNSGMASQIDITGGVHYYNKVVPGQRLALLALKNQYSKKIIANGPMYKGYKVKGDKLILELDHADGLLAGQSMTVKGGYADPVAIKDGAESVKLFYIADKDRVWHQAKVEIKGKTIFLTAPGLTAPCGVAYGCTGVGTQPGIYNKAMLPLTPFIYYKNELVTSASWPMDHLKIAGKVVDPTTYGAQSKYRKLALLSPQFRDGAVIQSDLPTRIYGKALPNSVVKLTFGGVEKIVKIGPNNPEWEATFPAMPASDEKQTIHVSCTLDGVLAHERTITNILIGDLWYISLQNKSMPGVKRWPNNETPAGSVRMLMAVASKRSNPVPERFKLSSSGSQHSRFYSLWAPPQGLAKALGERIHAKTGKPVGIIIMNATSDLPIKAWVGYSWLKQVPSWKADGDELYSRYAPDPKVYADNADAYIKDWQAYWQKIATDPSFSRSNDSGGMPRFPGSKSVKTPATMTYNMLIAAFGPANFKGVICLTPKSFIGADEGASFGGQFSVMANCWKDTFMSGKSVIDPHFVYALPNKSLASKIVASTDIKGKSTAIELKQWPEFKIDPETRQTIVGQDLTAFLDAAVKAVYK